MAPPSLARRRLVRAAGLALAIALAPRPAGADERKRRRRDRPDPEFVDPYAGVIPLVFPLAAGAYRTPLADNWHAGRDGPPQPWSHRDADGRRAHDGVDVYPLAGDPIELPTVYAPFAAAVVAGIGRVDADGDYRVAVSHEHPPPQDYAAALYEGGGPEGLYGNFVWLRSVADDASRGYLAFFCHLQAEPFLRELEIDRRVDAATPVGVLGDTGNAAGEPQLHVELHYPEFRGFACARCGAGAPERTAIDPFASLAAATRRR